MEAKTAIPAELHTALAAHGIPTHHMQAVRRIAEQDPDSNYPDQRLIKAPAYAKDCLRRANSERDAQRASEPRCLDHTEQPAAHCGSCIADVKAGERPRELIGKHMRFVPDHDDFDDNAPF